MFAYNLLHVLAFAAASWLLARSFRRRGLPGLHAVLLCAIVFCASRFSARFFHALEVARPLQPWTSYFTFGAGPSSQLAGLLPSVAIVAAYALALRIPFAVLFDLAAVPGCVAIAIGRVGCQLAGCCVGPRLPPEWALPAWLSPSGNLPAPLLEMAAALAVAYLLLRIPDEATPGVRASGFFVLHGAARFNLQWIRTGETSWGPLTTTQVLSLATVALGAALYFFVTRRASRARSEPLDHPEDAQRRHRRRGRRRESGPATEQRA